MGILNFQEEESNEDVLYNNQDEEIINQASTDNSLEKSNLGFEAGNLGIDFSFNFQEEEEEGALEDSVGYTSEEDAQQDLINQVLKDIKAAETGFGVEETDNQEKEITRLFEQKQNEFLSGKVVLKDIINADGDTVVKIGNIITPDIIRKAKSQRKLIELIMNCD